MTNTLEYASFLASKNHVAQAAGFDCDEFNACLFGWQCAVVKWAVKRGRAAIFADCGLGKTLMQLEWARQVHEHTDGHVLILAPLAVGRQTQEEGARFGIEAEYRRDGNPSECGITITNYEMLEHFDPDEFIGVVLDESSILKNYTGKTRAMITNAFIQTPYKLACTATPAPNDHMELGTHSEFLSIMRREEMLATFFCHDGGETQSWRLKGHAVTHFWKWMASWAVCIRTPKDIGFECDGYDLPELRIQMEEVESGKPLSGRMFVEEALELGDRLKARRETVGVRAARVAEIVAASKPDEQWLVWCNLNDESATIAKLIPGAVEVSGSDSIDHKEKSMKGFSDGSIRVMVSKPSICGFGMNWQNCHKMAFVGLSDSYEQFYQAVRRCWRFGQKSPVDVHVVTADLEGAVVDNIKKKEAAAMEMQESMVRYVAEFTDLKDSSEQPKEPYVRATKSGDNWTMHRGDCVEVVSEMESDSIGFSVFSPPFASLYTYSNSDRDMGNCRTHSEFFEHFTFLAGQLLRVTKPGRLCSFHCMNLPTSKSRDGFIGISDFRGDLIRIFQNAGWIYHSEVCIWKDPVTAMQRTKALGLLHKQLKKDSCMSRQGIADYVVTMRKPGDNPDRVTNTNESFPVQLWQQYASPVWMDINPSDTLQYRSAREHDDERHICPLQLEVIRRCIKLWTKPGDLVLSPFAGIGSEGFVSIEQGRKFVGVELKESYFGQACKNLENARPDVGMFDEF